MRTHYRGGYGVSDYGNQDQEPPVGQSNQTWQRRAAADWLNERERRERHAAGQGPMRDRGDRGSTGPGGYDPNERAYEHFTGANERSDLNRGYGGAGGSAAARRAQRTGPKGYQRSDERIREDLCERLAMSGRVDVREVEVSVASGVVTLSGTVQDRQQKYRIEDMAEEVFGVKDVHNQIRVTRESAMSGRVGGGMGGNTSGMSGLSGRGAMGDQGRSGGSSLSQGLGSPASQGGTAPSSAAGSTGSLGTGIGSNSGSTAGSGFGSSAMPGTNSTTSGKSGG
ncbi:RNA-binding protein [Cupriavidus pauculus]|uniref:RNA-binding protein n=2 Tax=Cupriavidus pauculus TaxID=82633 RepID=A0A2N5C4Y5_9BURK|nr:RNA-binding protein [Cupriavidus pauculus]